MRSQCHLLLLFILIPVSSSIKCFCDRFSCEENLVCHAQYCIIGLTRDSSDSKDNKLRQMCGSGELAHTHIDRCDQKAEEWQEVCYCNDEFCNTFAFLRSSMDAHSPSNSISSDVSSPSSGSSFSTAFDSPYPLVPKKDGGGRHQRSSLIVLLVIIPLSVGALAVCLIFLNYHCKMC